jgi:hypothetical protein
MKSQLLSVLTVVGVLGTATAALAVNTDTLASLDVSAGEASNSVPATTAEGTSNALPLATPAPTTAPGAPVTVSPDGSITGDGVQQPNAQPVYNPAPAPVAAVAPAPVAPAPVDATTGGSGAPSGSYDDDDDEGDDSSYEDHDEEEDEDDD